MTRRIRIAIVGSGISGISAAHLLHRHAHVSLFESEARLGGHTHTVVLQSGPDAGLAVDTGFIVYNNRTYPIFENFLKELNVNGQDSDMSFSFQSRDDRIVYNGTSFDGLFADRKNLLSPRFWKFLRHIYLFNQASLRSGAQSESALERLTMRDYLAELRSSDDFKRWYLQPMAAAIWSAPLDQILEFPAAIFVRFFLNHGLLELTNRPQWKTVVGGSHSYLHAFEKSFSGQIFRAEGALKILRHQDRLELLTTKSRRLEFDRVILACHADEALKLIDSPSPEEVAALGAWSYSDNRVYLHTDESTMPTPKRAWASWNSKIGSRGEEPTLTYHMNRLQRLSAVQNYFVSLNPKCRIAENQIIKEIRYTHPQYNLKAIQSRDLLHKIQGLSRTYFCGAYLGYGFHEDGARSGVEVAQKILAEGL